MKNVATYFKHVTANGVETTIQLKVMALKKNCKKDLTLKQLNYI